MSIGSHSHLISVLIPSNLILEVTIPHNVEHGKYVVYYTNFLFRFEAA